MNTVITYAAWLDTPVIVWKAYKMDRPSTEETGYEEANRKAQ